MMGNTRNDAKERNPFVALFAELFSILLDSPFGTIFKANIKATVVFWAGVIIGIVLSVTVDWKVGVLVFVGFWVIAILMLGLGAIRAAKRFRSSSFASIRDDDHLLSGDFPGFGKDFPSPFGSSRPQRPSRSTEPRYPASTSQANSCGSAYGDPDLHGVDTDCEHSAPPFEVYVPTGGPTPGDDGDNSTHDGHTVHQHDGSAHTSSSSDNSSTGSSDSGSSSSSSTD